MFSVEKQCAHKNSFTICDLSLKMYVHILCVTFANLYCIKFGYFFVFCFQFLFGGTAFPSAA